MASATDSALAGALQRYSLLTDGECHPQPAALRYDASGDEAFPHRERHLDTYFPIIHMLSDAEIERFYRLIQSIIRDPRFDLQLIGEKRRDLSAGLPPSAAHLLAGHLAETFFFHQELLERLLAAKPRFQLYTTARAFRQDGGELGGDFNPRRRSVQLVLSRLFEGFNGPTPGVCPFLHEFGHLLDHFDLDSGKIGHSAGLLPGLGPKDGQFYNPQARGDFIAGKALELERYLARYHGTAAPGDPLPIGHPYVFQNDTEFIAGYFEMFFRNPHYFAGLNPDLYAALTGIFGYDPRKAWKADFQYYIEQNRAFYLSGQRPPKTGIHIPKK